MVLTILGIHTILLLTDLLTVYDNWFHQILLYIYINIHSWSNLNVSIALFKLLILRFKQISVWMRWDFIWYHDYESKCTRPSSFKIDGQYIYLLRRIVLFDLCLLFLSHFPHNILCTELLIFTNNIRNSLNWYSY